MKDKHKQMYMRIAEAVAETSNSKRLKVGAVAVKNNQVIGTGYNALPAGLGGDMEDKVYFTGGGWIDLNLEEYPYEDDTGKYKLVSRPEVRHAEKNLILSLAKSTESARGASIFLTHSCCKMCSMDLVDVGITHVYYKHKYRCDEGLTYLRESNIIVEQID